MDKNIIGFMKDGEEYMKKGKIWINTTEGKNDFWYEIPYRILTGDYVDSCLIYKN